MSTNHDNLYPNVGDAKGDGVSAKQKSKMPGEQEQAPVTGLRALYWREIERYNRATNSWYDDGDSIVDIYMATAQNSSSASSTRKFPLLWANVETLKPAVYTKAPNVMCTRRWKDRDPIARTASELLERACNTTFEIYNVDETFRMVRDDRLLPGRGTAWVRYEATIEEYETDGEPAEDSGEVETVTAQRLKAERVCVDYVHWKDFGHNVARTWADVWLVWRIVYKTKDEVEERFGAEIAGKLSYTAKSPASGSGTNTDDPDMRCRIFELWDKRRSKTSWIAEGFNEFLETGEPPTHFETGFPCPEPCYATKTSKDLIPKPDYNYYRDQAKEINDLTEKIQRMTKWLIVKGFVPGGPSTLADPLEEAIKDKTNAELFVQVDSMAEWNESGGVAKLIDWLPIDMVIKAIQAAISARGQLIQDVYQITGISDIIRGQSDPNETLGAQQLKAQTSTRRLRNTRDEIARFTRDIARLTCEIIADQFSPKSIADMTGFKYLPPEPAMPAGAMQIFPPGVPMPPMMGLPQPGPPVGSSFGQPAPLPMGQQLPVSHPMGLLPPRSAPPGLPGTPPMPGMQDHPMMPGQDQMQSDPNDDMTFDDQVMQLLRDDRMRGFRIDVETDSTIQADEQAEKQGAMEFIGAIGPYMQQAVQAVEMAPALAPAFGEILMMAIRRFRAGVGLEQTIEKSFQQMAQQVLQAKSQPPPQLAIEQAKVQQQGQNDQAKLAVHGQIEQGKLAAHAQETQTAAALDANEQRTNAALEARKQNLDFAAKERDRNASASAKAMDRAARMLSAHKSPGTMQ